MRAMAAKGNATTVPTTALRPTPLSEVSAPPEGELLGPLLLPLLPPVGEGLAEEEAAVPFRRIALRYKCLSR